jgi:tetratricopeptide (TPR) repeat protein
MNKILYNKFKYLCLPIICIILHFEVKAQTDSTHQLIINGIDFASTLQYEKAIEVFDKIINLQPENPRGYFLKSAAYFWIFSTDMHNEAVGDTLKEWSLRAVEVAENRLNVNENDIDALFFLGGAYGTLGRYYGATKSYIKAYWYGQKGKNYLEQVIENDSTYYDAYLGLGIYHYLADILPKFVKILSFILGLEGDKDQGIAELNLAAEKGIYTKTEALFFLGAIYTYREREYEKAVKIFNRLLQQYPNNCGALIHLGRCYSYMGKCEMALQTFFKILNSGDEKNRIPLTSLHYQMGDVYFRMNNFFSAIGSFTIAVESDTSSVGSRRWTFPWALYKLGLCYEIIGKHERAKYFYYKVNEEDSERAYNLTQKNLLEPLDEIDIAIIRNRNNGDCGKYNIALESFQNLREELISSQTIRTKQKLTEINFHIGKIKCDLGRHKESIKHFRQVLEENTTDEHLLYWTHYWLGNCYRKTGDIENALEQYDLASDTEDIDLLNRINKAVQNITDRN